MFIGMISHTMLLRLLMLTPLAAIAACATPQNRVEAGLIKAGVSPRMASCMAPRMADRLSVGQLRKLQALSHVARRGPGKMRVNELLDDVRALDDPEIVGVTSKAALVCALDI